MSRSIITLTTDFGCQDPFVGIMKGVILKINPEATIVDISSGVRQYDIRGAAYTIGMSYEFFPAGTIHVAVVDPGVGSRRRPIMVLTNRHYFIGPDNGIFSHVYAKQKEEFQVLHLTANHYFLAHESPTFQGRDIFSSVAGYLSRGVNVMKFGELITDFSRIPLPVSEVTEKSVKGEVIRIDRFGNAITNVSRADVEKLSTCREDLTISVFLFERELPLREFYSQGTDNELSALFNSSGFLELFVRQGNAAEENKIVIGDVAEVVVDGKPS